MRIVFLVLFIPTFLVSCIYKPTNPDTLHPQDLRCNGIEKPEGIDCSAPSLSWTLITKQRTEKQTGYRILVASTPDSLLQDIGDFWDSKKVSKDEQHNIKYNGKTLLPANTYYWKIKAWD